MADDKRHWKESIGVVGRPRVRKPVEKTTKPKDGDAPPPADQAAKSAVTETAPMSARRPRPKTNAPNDTKKAPAARPQAKPRAIEVPGGSTVSAKDQARDAALAPVAELLAQLPIGSMDFARQFAERLWVRPSATDLRNVSLIAERHARIVLPVTRRHVLRAVLIRQKVHTLLASRHQVLADPARLDARAREWTRLQTVTVDTRDGLDAAKSHSDEDAILTAAAELLPNPHTLGQEAALCAALAGLVDSLAGHGDDSAPLAARVVPEAQDSLKHLCHGEVSAGEVVFLELTATLLLAHQDLALGEREKLERDRGLLGRIAERIEEEITAMMSAHRRDPQASEKLAAWRRRLGDMRARVDEALTRPDSELETERTPSGAHEDAVLARLQAVQGGNEKAADVATTGPRGWRKLIPFLGGALAIALLGTLHWVLPGPLPRPPEITPKTFEGTAALSQVVPAGAFLVATADPGWERLEQEEPQTEATRLMLRAETEGFSAGLLMAADGRPLASWSPGREPEIRRPLGVSLTATAQGKRARKDGLVRAMGPHEAQ